MDLSLDSQRTYRKVNYKVGQGRASEAHKGIATMDRFVQKVLEVRMFPVGCRKRGQQFLSPVTSQHNMLWRGGGGPSRPVGHHTGRS